MKSSLAISKEAFEKDLKFNVRSLGVDKLKTIYYVGLTESMTKAGDLMGLCQSAVSRQIQTLEDDLGFIMFKRKDRKVEITKEGKIMMEMSHKSLYEMDATVKSIKEAKEGLSGTLKILTFPSFASTIMPRYLRGFKDLYPDILLQINASYAGLNPLDADIVIRQFIPKNPLLKHMKLYDQVIGMYASQSYLEKCGVPQTLEDLDHHQLLALDQTIAQRYSTVNWILKVGGRDTIEQREATIYLNSHDTLAQAITHGLGIGGLAHHHVKLLNNPNIVRVLPSIKTEPLPIYCIYNKSVKSNQKYSTFYEYLKNSIDNDKEIFYTTDFLENPVK